MPSFSTHVKHIALLICALAGAASAQTNSVVTVDSNNVLVINGTKVFPIGMSPGPPNNSQTPDGSDGLQELRDAGVQLLRINQTNNWDSALIAYQQAALDWAAQHDMYIWLNLRELSEFSSTDTTTPASLRNIVDMFRNHPALGLWKNYDEAWWGGISEANLQNGYEVIKQEDTNHPVVQTHAPRGMVSDLQPYNAAADIIAVDIYPVTAAGAASNPPITNTGVSQVGDWALEMAQVTGGQKEVWLIEQIAFSGTTPPSKTLVFPTFTQSRYMAYQVIIDGARGLMFFGGNIATTLDAQDAPLGWNWTFWNSTLKAVVQQLGDHGQLVNALTAPNSTLPITMSGTTNPDLEFCVREASPYLYILASKREGNSTNVTFSGLPSWATNAEVLYESNRTIAVHGSQFTDTFAPLDVHVYRFSQTNQSPTILFQSESLTNTPGTTANFFVMADGTGPLAYQWMQNGSNLSDGGNVSGSSTSSLTLSSVAASNVGSYIVTVRGYGSVTSALAATLTVPTETPIINSQPQSLTNAAGTSASFSVGATGVGLLTYQWIKNGVPLSDGGNVHGSAAPALVLARVTATDAGSYQVIVSNNFGPTSSSLAILNVSYQFPFYDPFNDPPGAILGQQTNSIGMSWAEVGTSITGPSVLVGTNNLSTPGLSSSSGFCVQFGGSAKSARFSIGPANTIKSGTIYYSHIFQVTDLTGLSTNGVFVSGFNNSVGTQTGTPTVVATRLYLRATTNGGYNIGTAKNSSTNSDWVWDTRTFTTADVVFLVGSYTFYNNSSSNDVSQLWINPSPSDFGAAAPSSVPLVATTGADIGSSQIASFVILQRNSQEPPQMIIDELRIGLTWASVTPPEALPPFSITRAGFQFIYTNQTGQTYHVYASTNFHDWTSIGSPVQILPNIYQFIDVDSANYPLRYYQLR